MKLLLLLLCAGLILPNKEEQRLPRKDGRSEIANKKREGCEINQKKHNYGMIRSSMSKAM